MHGAVPGGGDAKPTKLSRLLGDELLPHGQGGEPPGLEIVSQLGEELPPAGEDGAGRHSIHACRPCPSVPPYPIPRNGEEGGIGDEVEQVIEPTSWVVGSPSVQLGLDLQYPGLGLVEVGPRRAGVHR